MNPEHGGELIDRQAADQVLAQQVTIAGLELARGLVHRARDRGTVLGLDQIEREVTGLRKRQHVRLARRLFARPVLALVEIEAHADRGDPEPVVEEPLAAVVGDLGPATGAGDEQLGAQDLAEIVGALHGGGVATADAVQGGAERAIELRDRRGRATRGCECEREVACTTAVEIGVDPLGRRRGGDRGDEGAIVGERRMHLASLCAQLGEPRPPGSIEHDRRRDRPQGIELVVGRRSHHDGAHPSTGVRRRAAPERGPCCAPRPGPGFGSLEHGDPDAVGTGRSRCPCPIRRDVYVPFRTRPDGPAGRAAGPATWRSSTGARTSSPVSPRTAIDHDTRAR